MPYKLTSLEDILKKLPASSIARIDKRAAEIRAEIDADEKNGARRHARKPVKAPALKP
jgi:hypothetical protein